MQTSVINQCAKALNVTPDEAISLRHMCSLGLTVGATSGAAVVLFDCALCEGPFIPADTSLLVLYVAAITALAAIPVVVGFGLIRNFFMRGLSYPAFVAVVWGLGLQCAALLTLDRVQLILVLPLCWLTCCIAYVFARHGSPPRVLPRTLAILLMSALLAAAIAQLQIQLQSHVLLLISVFLMALILFGTHWLAGRGPASVNFLLVTFASIVLAFGGNEVGWMAGDAPPSSTPVQPQTLPRPNIVMIVLDTTRFDHLGCYGNRQGLTPRLDAFAADSTVYLDTYTTGPWTLPSHASLFTGYFTQTHGCANDPHRWLDDGFDTLAEMLVPNGYQTVALFANNYLLNGNLLQGFQEIKGLGTALRGSRVYSLIAQSGWPAKWSDKGAAQGLNSLKHWLSQKRRPTQPYFLFINLLEPHYKLFPPIVERLKHLPSDVSYLEAIRVVDNYFGAHWHAGKPYTQREVRIMQSMYAAAVEYQDHVLGKMLAELQSASDADQTMIIITSDHGENLGDGNRWDHQFALNDTLLHVPMIIRYPNRLGRGERIAGLNQLVDVVPTVFDVLGVKCPENDLPGRSLIPGRFKPRPFVVAQSSPFYLLLEMMHPYTGLDRDVHEFTDRRRMIRNERFKLKWSSHGTTRLFDVIADPEETKNVADIHPDVVREMSRQMESWWAEIPQYQPRPGTGNKSKLPGQSGLKHLGYLQ